MMNKYHIIIVLVFCHQCNLITKVTLKLILVNFKELNKTNMKNQLTTTKFLLVNEKKLRKKSKNENYLTLKIFFRN